MNPYEELEISPAASSEEIKNAYRRLAKQYHPDSNPNSPEALEKMNRINAAYKMLREGAYDLELGEDWYREQAKEGNRKEGILYNLTFRRVVMVILAASMVAVGIVSAFFSALYA